MRYVVLALALAACSDSGVSSHPQSPDWDVSVEKLAEAWCEWNATCGTKNDPTCVATVTSIMTSDTRPEVASEEACVTCMHAWTDALHADIQPCTSTLTFDQQQAISAACADDCVQDHHDLPGTSPQ